jgi:branched-chain amino acid transport system ATP-binding protein
MTGPTQPLLVGHDLTRRFGTLTALSHVDIKVMPGSRHALIGPNGAGKTTLLRLIAGTLRPTTGRITFQGSDITRLPAHRRAQQGIGYAFQTPTGLPGHTVIDNLIAGAWPHTPPRPGRYRRLAEYYAGLMEITGGAENAWRRAGDLSHGQRRQLDITVALTGPPTLLLLDEPAAGLADQDIDHLTDLIQGLPATTTVLMVEHHLDLVAGLCDTVTTLTDGHHTTTTRPPAAGAGRVEG